MKQPENSTTTLDQSIWHVLEAESVITRLGSDQQNGFSSEEAKQRLQQYGPNTLQTSRQIP